VTAAAFRSPTVASSVVDTPASGRRRSSSVTLSPPILSPAYDIEQSQSVPLRTGRAASLQRAASRQRRSQRPPSLSPTQWMGSYGSPSPPIGSDIETDYPAARPTVYHPRSIEASQAPLQVDSRPRAFPGVSLAAEVQPSSPYVASTRTYTRSDTATLSSDMGQRSFEPMYIDVAAHPHVSPSIIADVAPLPITVAARQQLPVIVSRPSTVDVRKPMSSVGRRQSKSLVSTSMNEPTLGSMRDQSQTGVIGFAEPRPTSIDVGHPLSEGVARPSPMHARPTPTHTPTSMSAGLMSAAHAVCPSSVDAHVSRPTLADDESAI